MLGCFSASHHVRERERAAQLMSDSEMRVWALITDPT